MSTTDADIDTGPDATGTDRALVMCRHCRQLVPAGTTWDVTTPDGFPYPFCSPACLHKSTGWHHP